MTRIVVLIAALAALSACNTMRGAGQDIESAGQGLQSEAAKAQSGM